jgi:hypothetical protein
MARSDLPSGEGRKDGNATKDTAPGAMSSSTPSGGQSLSSFTSNDQRASNTLHPIPPPPIGDHTMSDAGSSSQLNETSLTNKSATNEFEGMNQSGQLDAPHQEGTEMAVDLNLNETSSKAL